MSDTDSDYCDQGDHAWEQTDIKEWNTRSEALNKRYHTVIYDCADCPASRYSRERRNGDLSQW